MTQLKAPITLKPKRIVDMIPITKLRAAKKRKVLTYDGELLLQGVHDNVEITLMPQPVPS